MLSTTLTSRVHPKPLEVRSDLPTTAGNDHRGVTKRSFPGVVYLKALFCVVVLTRAAILIDDKLDWRSTFQDSKEPDRTLTKNDKVTKKKFSSSGHKIAWLMSFPNSGTSFTLRTVRHSTLSATASNYGKEEGDSDSIPVIRNALNGPYWKDLKDMPPGYTYPNSYVLTKTHCGGRCVQCGPFTYIETPSSFLQECLSGHRNVVSESGDLKYEDVKYEASLVEGAVHLIRNPFDNVVSRFHLAQKRRSGEMDFPKSREGFRAFCKDLDKTYAKEEQDARLVDSEYLEIMKDVPCHADFYRYAQWHNLAFITTDELDIPTHVMNYEDYGTSYEETLDRLLNFLEVERKGVPAEFRLGKEYSEYFDPKEREAVKKGMQILATRKTWKYIQRYFEGI